jgi:SDR family mycofactocin-dependent oxidoreductase
VGRVDGKVAFITGAARGQGRSHALRLAQEGADIIALDLCQPIESVPYALPTGGDLIETVKMVEELDRRIVAREADVRDLAQVQAVVEEGISEFGHIDIVCANAGIASFAPTLEMDEQMWQDMIDINLTGVWKTVRAAAAPMVERRQGGSIIFTSSVAGLFGFPNLAHYSAAKHGVVGMMRVLAQEFAPYMIRVNTVNPTTVNTPMVVNDAVPALFRPDLENPTVEDMNEALMGLNSLPIALVEAVDVSNAVLWLASDEARYITGVALPVDAGFCQKIGGTPYLLPE